MKKLLILALVLLAGNGYAQTDTDTHAQKVEYLFQHIEKPAKTGIWHDKAVSSMGLPYYGTKKDDRSNTAHWQQAYYELLVANDERSKFNAFLQNKLKRKAVNTIPLGLIDASIYFLDTTAIKNGIISQKTADTPFTRVKEGQVFQEKQIIVASLLNDAPLQANKSYKIELSSDFFLQHLAKNAAQITVTIEGREHSFTPAYNSNTINVVFKQVGTQILQIKVRYGDGTLVETKSEVEIDQDPSVFRSPSDVCYRPNLINAGLSAKANIQATIPFSGYLSMTQTLGMGEVAYYYADGKNCANNTPQTLTKPIIVIDGIDPLDKRSVEKIYGEKLAYDVSTPNPQNLGSELRAAGYDVVVLNFPTYIDNLTGIAIDGGADYVERNAMVLIKLIQDVNAQLPAGSTEKLVVFGPSMGGLIARFALAYMERNGLNHNTKLYASFDAPHNGSNIPMGAQVFLDYMGNNRNNAAAKIRLEAELNNVAAKQLILIHNTSGASVFRNMFTSALSYIGFPQNLRKVAIANGAINGTLYDGITNPGDEGLYMRVNGAQNSWSGKPMARANIYFSQGYGIQGKIFRFTKRAGLVGALFGTWSLYEYFFVPPSNSVSYDIAPGGIFPIFKDLKAGADTGPGMTTEIEGIQMTIECDIKKQGACFIPTKSALAFTGSNQDLGEALNNRSLVCSGETPFDAYYAPNTNEQHIELNTGNVAWILREINGTPNTNPPLVPPTPFPINIIRFDADAICPGVGKGYYANLTTAQFLLVGNNPTYNWIGTGGIVVANGQGTLAVYVIHNSAGTLRLEITPQNGCTLAVASINITVPPPADYTVGITKSFTNAPCFKFQGVYSASLTPAQLASIGTITGYNWIVTGGLNIISGQGTADVRIQHMTTGTLSLEITSDGLCIGRGKKTLNVNVGIPAITSATILDATPCITRAIVQFVDGVTSINVSGVTYPTTNGSIELFNPGVYFVSATNACGTSASIKIRVTSDPLAGCKTVGTIPKKSDLLPEITVFPNPVSTYLDVANILAGSEVKIYTKIGVLVHSEKSENDKIRLDISKLNTDLYILEAVLPDNVKVRKQIVKE